MSPQRCLSAIRTLRTDIEVASGGVDDIPRQAVNARLVEELRLLRTALQDNIDLRREPGGALQMTRLERTIYLPLIVGLLELVCRIEPPLPGEVRRLLKEARHKIDQALVELTASGELAPPRLAI